MHATRDDLDEALLRKAFSAFPSGVTVVAGMHDGVPAGLTASSFTSVSIEPPMVSVCVARTSTTWPRLHDLSHLGVSVLSFDQADVARALASKTQVNRFAAADWRSNERGAVMLNGAALWLECTLHSKFLAGDHEIVLLEILELETFEAPKPLVFHESRFHQLHPILNF